VRSRQPESKGSPTQRFWSRTKSRDTGDVDLGCKLVEEIDVDACDIGSSCQQRYDVAVGDFIQQRKHFGAHPIPLEPEIRVGDVIDDVKTEISAQPVSLGAAETEDRPRRGPDSGRAVEPATTHQIQKNRLRVIVSRVPGQDVARKDPVPQLACASLEIRTGRHVDGVRDKVGPEALGDGSDQIGLGR